MCRLFAMSAGRREARATFWLVGAPDSLSVQSHREPDGTGLGWFAADGSPLISKQPLAAYDDAEFARRAREVSSRCFVAHVRFASTGSLSAQNTHPFLQRRRLFAHNGVLGDLPKLDAELGPDVALVKGETDSERLFALITREIARNAGDIRAAIERACSWVAASLPLFAINFLLATAEGLWALRYPATHELYVLARKPKGRLEARSSLGSRVVSEHASSRPLVVLASERMDADPGWRLLESGELLHVDADLRVSSRRILSVAPAHPLTIADLDERARASQQAGGAGAVRAPRPGAS